MADKTVKEEYEKWWSMVFGKLPQPAPDSKQTTEMRNAFYAGSFVMMGLLTNLVDTYGEDDDGAAAAMSVLDREMKSYFNDIMEKAGLGKNVI